METYTNANQQPMQITSQTQQADLFATVDLGSNSFRLQISQLINDHLYQVDSLKETVRLGAGLDLEKKLNESAKQLALDCLARFGERLRGFLPEQVRAVATNTFRIAKNIEQFVLDCEQKLGFSIDVIAGREEARLIYLGAAQTLPAELQQRLVVDIGGGSTEFIIGSKFHPQMMESLPLGCVTYSERYFAKGKLNADNFRQATLAARGEIQRIRQAFRHLGWDIAIGTSGTARSLSDILHSNEQGEEISLSGLLWLQEKLSSFGQIKKINLIGLKQDREPVLPGGLAVMIAVFEEFGIKHMIPTEGALRDGVLYDLLGRAREHDRREETITQFIQRYHVDKAQANRVSQLAERLYRAVSGGKLDQALLKCIIWAAKMHEIGLSIAHTAYHKHSAYILQNADMSGFSRKEQEILSILVIGHRGDLRKMLPLINDVSLWSGVIALRLAALFYRRRKTGILPDSFDLEQKENSFFLHVTKFWLEKNPLSAYALKQEQTQCAKAGLNLVINER